MTTTSTVKKGSKNQRYFYGKLCDNCHLGTYELPSDGKEWHLECDACGAVLFCYVPQKHQHFFHADKTKIKMYAGGFGSGKTTTCAAEFFLLCMNTPNGMSLCGAQTYPQLEQTAKKELLDMIPDKYIDTYNKKDNYVDLINGHRILFRSFDDEGKIRSLNLCFAWIEEGSEVKYDIFVQLTTRLRNAATDKHRILISTNPDLGWIRTEFLLKAARIHNAQEDYYQVEHDINPDYAVHIAPTRLNKHLPRGFYQTTAHSKPLWWVKRFLDGSFSYSEGAVYPEFNSCVIEPFDIHWHIENEGWEVIGGADFGLRDPTVFLMAAIKPTTGDVIFFDEYYQRHEAVPYHADEINRRLAPIPYGKIRDLIADPSGARRSITDKTSLFDNYREYGIFFTPGNNRIEAGISKVYGYMALGKIKIFSTLKETIAEGVNYKYKPMDLHADKNVSEVPIDVDNHCMDTMRYMINTLPDDAENLVTVKVNALGFRGYTTKDQLPFALQTDTETVEDWYTNY